MIEEALDNDGKEVRAADAVPGKKYTCMYCGTILHPVNQRYFARDASSLPHPVDKACFLLGNYDIPERKNKVLRISKKSVLFAILNKRNRDAEKEPEKNENRTSDSKRIERMAIPANNLVWMPDMFRTAEGQVTIMLSDKEMELAGLNDEALAKASKAIASDRFVGDDIATIKTLEDFCRSHPACVINPGKAVDLREGKETPITSLARVNEEKLIWLPPDVEYGDGTIQDVCLSYHHEENRKVVIDDKNPIGPRVMYARFEEFKANKNGRYYALFSMFWKEQKRTRAKLYLNFKSEEDAAAFKTRFIKETLGGAGVPMYIPKKGAKDALILGDWKRVPTKSVKGDVRTVTLAADYTSNAAILFVSDGLDTSSNNQPAETTG